MAEIKANMAASQGEVEGGKERGEERRGGRGEGIESESERARR